MTQPDHRRTANVPAPPVSRRHEPKFADTGRKAELANAFLQQGAEYDHLRPGYPPEIVDLILDAAPPLAASNLRLVAVDLGAGTGKLAEAFAVRGLDVTAVDPSEGMLAVAAQRYENISADEVPRAGSGVDPALDNRAHGAGVLSTRVASAEETGLPTGEAHIVTAAQAWHWFDAERATAEVLRILRPATVGHSGGVLALVWNTLDVSIPWVHRYTRIAHAGDVQRDGFVPTVGEGLELVGRHTHRWVDARSTWDAVNLAKTRSYAITATPERRAKVLENLDWYLHEHVGHEPGSMIELPYRTDLFLYRARS